MNDATDCADLLDAALITNQYIPNKTKSAKIL